ncbi:hypothetical protein UZ36_02420 [Candidatus Nitromaritima sp. SCGC AAA799-C22]|nr:hypothetical protein UZ36_02420 [Candidatus Nitromaritima sp. SCGC AAA799-C22]
MMAAPIGSVNVNRLLNTIEKNRSGLKNSVDKIASGRRLNSAGTDAAAASISARLRSDIAALSQATRNVSAGNNFIRTAEGGLASIGDLVARGRELAARATNGIINDEQRQTLNLEFTQIKNEIDRLSGSLEFNGQKLLDGSLAADSQTQIDIQAGTGNGPDNQINLNVVDSVTTESLNIADSNIATAEAAIQAFEDLGRAQSQVITARGEVGAVGNRLLTASNTLGIEIENLTASESALADTDLAAEITTLSQGLLGFQTSIQSLANQLQFESRSQGRLLDTLG